MEQQMNLNLSLDKTKGITCDECGHNVFQEGMLLRKASRLLTGTAQDALIPIPVFSCAKCNHVNNEFMPVQLMQKPVQEEVIEPEVEEEENKGAKIITF
jgi:hypothetical protein